ncbi:MAG TPA: hypothetical protein VMD99_02455 [Terriglobales bacterium]|nr:hypothetical protein [Terriglobales bacterium]
MKGSFLCAVLTFALLPSNAAFSQGHSSGSLRWAEGAPNATSEVKNDIQIEGLKTADAHVFVSLSDIKETEYNRVWIQIYNDGKAPINFDPQSAILINEKDKTVRAEVAAKAANSIQKFGEAKSQELSSAHCENMVATQCQPTVSELQVSKQVAAYSAQQAQWLRDNGLTQKTIAPGANVEGYIPFKKDKKKMNYILKVTVGAQVFEFPVHADNKEPSFD